MDTKINEYLERYEIILSDRSKNLLRYMFDGQSENIKKRNMLLIVIKSANPMDEWPIYELNDVNDNEYELIGNFRQYMINELHEYGKKYENLQLLRNAREDLNQFSKKCESPLWYKYIENEKIENTNAYMMLNND